MINFTRIQRLFSDYRTSLDTLNDGISGEGQQREILEDFLAEINLENTEETRYAASQRLGSWKFEPLEGYLQKINKSRKEIDQYFEKSYVLTRRFVEKKQETILSQMREEALLPEFYMSVLEGHHEVGKLFSDLFLVWNRRILFGTNRELEERFKNDSDTILQFLEENDLFDLGHHGERADRSYSGLVKEGDRYKKASYFELFPEEITLIVAKIGELILQLDTLEDTLYGKKQEYISYYQSIIGALTETDCDNLVTLWSEVDKAWMSIDTPFQPAHPIEYYEDKYRKAVSIEIDFRIGNPELFESKVKSDIEHMFEGFFDEIGREGEFKTAYDFSRHSMQQVQLHLGVPFFSYGSFLCGMYSAQVVPNDTEVSRVYGKKIFAFPGFILQSYRAAPKMQLDVETVAAGLLQKQHDFIHGPDDVFYKIYDIETIGHEFGHTLWLTPDTEVKMNKQTGLFKNIEEFKATAGGIVAYFFSGNSDLREEVLLTTLLRNIKMMRYREVEDVIPYYCECLISLHIFYTSGIISIEDGKIDLHITDELYESFRETYIGVYTHQIHTYLNKKDAASFLHEYCEKINGVYLPKEPALKDWVEKYYEMYKEIGNKVAV